MTDTKIAWGKSINGIRLGILLKKNVYAITDSPIFIEIFIANDNTQKVQIIQAHVLHDYEFQLKNKDNQEVHLTTEGRKMLFAFKENNDASRSVSVIDPKMIYKISQDVKLDYLFDLKEPGIYTIFISMRNRIAGQEILCSGVFTFEITTINI